MLSLHLCELLRLAKDHSEQHDQKQGPAEMKLAEKVASATLEWMDAQVQTGTGLQSGLVDGTVISVQVCPWLGHSCLSAVWPLLTYAQSKRF